MYSNHGDRFLRAPVLRTGGVFIVSGVSSVTHSAMTNDHSTADESFGDTFSTSRDSGHREIADDVHLIQECIVKSATASAADEHMLSWHDRSEELHATQNAYLVTGEQSLLYDTLTPAGEQTILDNLERILGPEELDYLVISHPEANHAGNAGAILAEYPEATLVVSEYGVHHELFDVPEDARLVGDGDAIDLGHRTVEFHAPTFFDHAMTVFMSEATTNTYCTADWFGYEHSGSNCLRFADEQTLAIDCEYDVAPGQLNRHGGYAFVWFRYADPAKIDTRIDRFAAEHSPAIVAPAHGLPIRDRVDDHLKLMKDVIRGISEGGSNYHEHTHSQILLNKRGDDRKL